MRHRDPHLRARFGVGVACEVAANLHGRAPPRTLSAEDRGLEFALLRRTKAGGGIGETGAMSVGAEHTGGIVVVREPEGVPDLVQQKVVEGGGSGIGVVIQPREGDYGCRVG